MYSILSGRPGGSVVKKLSAHAGATRGMGLSHESGRSLGEGNGNTLQYSCLGNSMDRGAWQAIVHGVARVGPDLATKAADTEQGKNGCTWGSVF